MQQNTTESQRPVHTCPWWLAYTFDNRLRGLLHRPAEILNGLVRPGRTVVDIGAGLGFFTIAMAELVGSEGTVISVDLQPEMLRRARRGAERRGIADRIRFHQATPAAIGIQGPVDFVLAFWMVHEVADRQAFLAEIHSLLGSGGHLLIAEPKGHVSQAMFRLTAEVAQEAGFSVTDGPNVRLSRSILCTRR